MYYIIVPSLLYYLSLPLPALEFSSMITASLLLTTFTCTHEPLAGFPLGCLQNTHILFFLPSMFNLLRITDKVTNCPLVSNFSAMLSASLLPRLFSCPSHSHSPNGKNGTQSVKERRGHPNTIIIIIIHTYHVSIDPVCTPYLISKVPGTYISSLTSTSSNVTAIVPVSSWTLSVPFYLLNYYYYFTIISSSLAFLSSRVVIIAFPSDSELTRHTYIQYLYFLLY
ncbi:unnamed protein product [Orchesella dallaii]|uniref:Uncharacterized protein n=1 Tax=Orchesella dallaii TaxID=48710 RepID=A0ABP1QLT5_9HEXA